MSRPSEGGQAGALAPLGGFGCIWCYNIPMSNPTLAGNKKILALIDGKSVFYRGYYGMPHLSTKDGTPTGGVYGFAMLALQLINQIKPDYVAVAWDKPHTNIRRRLKIYSGYKAGRKPAPPDFYQQIPILHKLLAALGWPLYELDDYEADDIMGTLSKQANEQGIFTVMITSDLDMLQLIDDDTELFAMKKGLANIEKFDRHAFEEKYGIKVEQFLDLKALKGDNSDNIPGVPGVGEKTGIKLLQDYGTLDGVYEHVDEVKGSLHDKLINGRNSAYMSRELGLIMCDAPLTLDLKAMDMRNLDRAKLHKMLLDLEFTSLIKKLPDVMQDDSGEMVTTGHTLPNTKIIDSELPLSEVVMVQAVDDQLYLSPDKERAYKASWQRTAELLKGKRVITHDAKKLAEQFLSRNLDVNWTVEFDTKHAQFLINSLNGSRELSEIVADLKPTSATTTDQLATVWMLYNELSPELAKLTKLNDLAHNVDFPLQLLLAKIEARGMLVDTAQLAKMSDDLDGRINDLQSQIWQGVGYEFNIGSPKQLSEALFDKLGLPATKKRNKSGFYPTGAKELAKLHGANPVIELIEQYRMLTKLKSTYIDTLPKAVGLDGRIHTTFSQDVTATGRLSSSNPNLQNIPSRTAEGKEIKKCFVAPAGRVIVNADYAQFELRLAAALAHDQRMIEMFSDDRNDIHRMTAAEAYGIPVDQVTDEQRRHAKVINFGVLYGMSPHGLAEATGMDFGAAKKFIDRYFAVRQPIRDYLDQTLEMAAEQGCVETLFGRRRPTPDVKSSNFMVREAAKRAAANMPIQGTEADLMKMAMLRVEAALPDTALQVMQVHDSIMVECDEVDAPEIAAQMKQIMENIYPALGVRLLVDAQWGPSWGNL